MNKVSTDELLSRIRNKDDRINFWREQGKT